MGFKNGGSSSRLGFMKIVTLVFRFLQIVFALAVVGLYAQDLNKARKVGKYSDSKWGFATAIGVLSALTALVYAVLLLVLSSFRVIFLVAWDVVLFILWVAVFGLFGKMYIHEKAEMDSGIQRMKNAVWIDLVNMLLWFISPVFGFVGREKSLHTGRATL